MRKKKDWLVALALSALMAGTAFARGDYLMEIDGVKGEATTNGQQKPKDVKAKPKDPQKGLLLPAVQKASDVTPDSPPPSPLGSRPNIAAGDVNGDGNDDLVGSPKSSRAGGGDKVLGSGKGAHSAHSPNPGMMKVRKAGGGQEARKRRAASRGQIRTNQ